MTTFPSLVNAASSSTAAGLKGNTQVIQHSMYGQQFGLAAGSSLIGGGLVVGPQGYPLRQEGGTMVNATTADTIGNFGDYKISATGTTATFTVDNPVASARVRLVMNANPSTTIKFVTPSSNVTFSSSANSNGLTISSSLFFDQAAIELVGMSTAAYRVAGYVNTNGSSIGITYTT